MDGSRNPELQRLLANLNGAGFNASPQQQQPYQQQQAHQNPSRHNVWTPNSNQQAWLQNANHSQQSSIPGLGLPSSEQSSRSQNQGASIVPNASQSSTPKPEQSHRQIAISAENRSKTSTPSIPDASTITTWPAALKHVSRHLVPNIKFNERIKHLVAEQHKHERQWWAGREAIVARHNGRSGNSQRVADLLKSLGGASVQVADRDPKADEAELEAYDRKVYSTLR